MPPARRTLFTHLNELTEAEMSKKKAIDEWTKAFGQWHEAGSAVWAIAMKKIDRGFPDAIETKRAQQKLEAAHQRLVRAVEGL